MSYPATVFRVLIASPSDVDEEREKVRQVLQWWNDQHSMTSNAVLLPVDWKRQSTPELRSQSDRTEAIILKQLQVSACDLGIVLFATRFGSPTGVADSGTLEELLELVKAQKRVMPYLGTGRAPRNSAEMVQYAKVIAFKESWSTSALFGEYNSVDNLERQLKDGIVQAARELLAEHAAGEASRHSGPAAAKENGEFIQLRADFASLRADFNKVFESLTADRSFPDASIASDSPETKALRALEGRWKNLELDSTYYFKMVEGELRVAYCYGGDSYLTAEMYGCHLVDDVLFARFRWVNDNISGFIRQRVVTKDKLVGGWWYAQDVPEHLVNELTYHREGVQPPHLVTMNPSTLVRVPWDQTPPWVATFFAVLASRPKRAKSVPNR